MKKTVENENVKTKKIKADSKNVIVFLVVAATIIATILSITMPKLLLDKKASGTVERVMQAPDDYYLASRTATARNASSNLSSLDRMRLIYGTWSSTLSECSITDGFLSEAEILALAKEQLEKYYQAGLYPISLYSDYNNWYSFDCKLYQYTDDTFETYTAYLWELTFTKYDTSIYHKLLMSESGTILCADTNMDFPEASNIYSICDNANEQNPIGDSSLYYGEVTKKTSALPRLYDQIDSTDAKLTNMYIMQVKTLTEDYSDFAIFQYKKSPGYGFAVVPSN